MARKPTLGKAWILLAVMILAGPAASCTLLSVGRFVKNEYGPAMGRGDTRKLARLSTPELADLYERLTDEQFRKLMRLGSPETPDSSSGSSAGKPPSGSLDSFSSSGSRARLRVKSGGQKITFLVRRIRGKWRVEDLWIHQPDGHWSFRDVLGLYSLALRLGEGIKTGHIDPALVDPALHAALEPLVQRAKLWKLFEEKPENEKEENTDGPGLRLVKLAFSEECARIEVARGSLEISVRAVRKKQDWQLAGVDLQVPGRPRLSLEPLARTLGPLLMLLGDMRYLPGPESYAYERVASLLDERLRRELDPVLAPLWRSLAPLVPALVRPPADADDKKTPAKKRMEKQDAVALWLERIHWEIPDDGGLDARVRFDDRNGMHARVDAHGRVAALEVSLDGQVITPAHLAGFAPFTRWWESVASGAWPDPVRWVREGILLLDEPHARIAGLLPATFSLVPAPLVAATRTASRFSSRANPAAPHLPPMKLVSLRIASTRLDLAMQAWEKTFRWTWNFSGGIWRLSSVQLDGSLELLDFLHLLPPAWRLAEGLATGDGKMAASALGPQAQARMGTGLEELLRVQGDFFRRFSREISSALLAALLEQRTTHEAATAAATANGATEADPAASLRVDTAARVLHAGNTQWQFGLRADGVWGIELPEPLPVRQRREVGDHLLAVPELWPVLAALYLGLAQESPGRLAAFSSPDFNARVWRKLGRSGLRNLMKKMGISIELPDGRALVGAWFLAPQTITENRPKSGTTALRITGTQLRMQGRWPFAKIFLDAGGKAMEIKFSWDSRRRMLVLDDVRVTVPIFGRPIRLSLKNDLNKLL